MSLIRKHGAVLQAWACLDLVLKTIETLLVHLYQSADEIAVYSSLVQYIRFCIACVNYQHISPIQQTQYGLHASKFRPAVQSGAK